MYGQLRQKGLTRRCPGGLQVRPFPHDKAVTGL